MKILHVCETAIGGIATYFKLFDAMRPAGAESVFLVPQGQARHFAGTPLTVRTYAGGRSVRGIFNMIAAMRQALRDEPFDVVFFHSTFSLFGLIELKRQEALGQTIPPTIYCPHGWSISRLVTKGSRSAWALRIAEGRVGGLADRTINISAHDLALAQANGYRGRHVLIENAVADRALREDARPFTQEEGAIDLLFVGRFDRQKGVDILLDAFAAAKRRRPELRLHIVGGQVLGDQLLALPESAHHAGWVPVEQLDAWYGAADALVVPSRWEGFGLVVPEAYRNGTPVITSRCGALPDLVEEGVTGYAVDHEDLAERLATLDAAALAAMRPEARAAYEARFRPEGWAARFTALLEELVRERGLRR